MIRQQFNVDGYWKVVVYYNLDYDFFGCVIDELLEVGISRQNLETLCDMMESRKAKAVTYSNSKKHISIVLFNTHASKADYINSLVHEAEHVKQAMLKEYDVEDEGENPAYTIGYLVKKMWEVYSRIK